MNFIVSKKKYLQNCNLYLILDRDVNSYDELFSIAKVAVTKGVDILQIRDKKGHAKEIAGFSKKLVGITKHRIPVIVNDRADIALLTSASGVHVGQDDISVAEARRLLGPKAIIGASCQSMKHVIDANEDGADYI